MKVLIWQVLFIPAHLSLRHPSLSGLPQAGRSANVTHLRSLEVAITPQCGQLGQVFVVSITTPSGRSTPPITTKRFTTPDLRRMCEIRVKSVIKTALGYFFVSQLKVLQGPSPNPLTASHHASEELLSTKT